MVKLRAFALAAACAAVAPGVSLPADAANAVRIPHMRSYPVINLRMLQIKALQHAYRLFTQQSLIGTTRAAQAKAYAQLGRHIALPFF